MLDPPLAIANGLLCAAAIWFAAHVRSGRSVAVGLASLLLVNFVICALGYTDFAPKHVLNAMGIPATTKDTWAVMDAINGCAAIYFAYRYWWGRALWALSIVQEALHFGRMVYGIDPFVYTDCLAWVLWAQIALFISIGGRGARNRSTRFIADLGRRGFRRRTAGQSRASHRKEP